MEKAQVDQERHGLIGKEQRDEGIERRRNSEEREQQGEGRTGCRNSGRGKGAGRSAKARVDREGTEGQKKDEGRSEKLWIDREGIARQKNRKKRLQGEKWGDGITRRRGAKAQKITRTNGSGIRPARSHL